MATANEIRLAQHMLRLPVTGAITPGMQESLLEYQKAHNLMQTGVLDYNTMTVMIEENQRRAAGQGISATPQVGTTPYPHAPTSQIHAPAQAPAHSSPQPGYAPTPHAPRSQIHAPAQAPAHSSPQAGYAPTAHAPRSQIHAPSQAATHSSPQPGYAPTPHAPKPHPMGWDDGWARANPKLTAWAKEVVAHYAQTPEGRDALRSTFTSRGILALPGEKDILARPVDGPTFEAVRDFYKFNNPTVAVPNYHINSPANARSAASQAVEPRSMTTQYRSPVHDKNGQDKPLHMIEAGGQFHSGRVRNRGTEHEHGATHTGVDFRMPSGTPLHAIGTGVVTSIGREPLGGNFITVSMNDGKTFTFRHIKEAVVNMGQRVGPDSGPIALSGASGNASRADKEGKIVSASPQLHMEITDPRQGRVNVAHLVPVENMRTADIYVNKGTKVANDHPPHHGLHGHRHAADRTPPTRGG